MKSFICDNSDVVLLLGEGNFSFSRDFLELNKDFPAKQLYSTCFEKDADTFSSIKTENIVCLQKLGVNVLCGIDSTKISDNEDINKIKFTKVIFNFPHIGGKMKINLNRNLLKDFLIDASKLLNNNKDGLIIVSLCKGQSGIKWDEKRNWEDTWKIIEMSGYAKLLLKNLEYFNSNVLKYYSSFGFRSREQNFNTMKGIIHTFKMSDINEIIVDESTMRECLQTQTLENIQCSKLHVNMYNHLSENSIFSFFYYLFIDYLKSNYDLVINKTDIITKQSEHVNVNSKEIYRIVKINELLNDFKISPLEISIVTYNKMFYDICINFIQYVISLTNTEHIKGTYLLIDLYNQMNESRIKKNKSDNIVKNYEQNFKLICKEKEIKIKNENNNKEILIFECVYDRYVFKIQSFIQFISKNNWKIIFSNKNNVEINYNNNLVYQFTHLSPYEYKFDINFTVKSSDYTHEKFYLILWHIKPNLIKRIELINEHQSNKELYKSYLFRVWYKSYDLPMYRKKVIDIHQNIIGTYLNLILGVKVD